VVHGYLAIVASMLIWGSVGIVARRAGQDPLITVTYRVLFASLALALVTLFESRPQGKTTLAEAGLRLWGFMVLSGLALAANWLFFFRAIAATSVTNAVLSYYTAPVILAVTAPLLLREPLERRTLTATALAFGGVALMLYQPGNRLSPSDIAGIAYGLVAACFYAAVTILGRWLSQVAVTRLVLIQTLVASLVLVTWVLCAEGAPALAVPAGALFLLAVIGVIHTALALILYFVGLRSIKVQHAGVLAYLDPVSAVLFAYLFLGEVPSLYSLAGGGLVLAGSALLLVHPTETEAA
jgi:RarD protein